MQNLATEKMLFKHVYNLSKDFIKILNEVICAFAGVRNSSFVSKLPKTNIKYIIFASLTIVVFFVLSLLGIINLIVN